MGVEHGRKRERVPRPPSAAVRDAAHFIPGRRYQDTACPRKGAGIECMFSWRKLLSSLCAWHSCQKRFSQRRRNHPDSSWRPTSGLKTTSFPHIARSLSCREILDVGEKRHVSAKVRRRWPYARALMPLKPVLNEFLGKWDILQLHLSTRNMDILPG